MKYALISVYDNRAEVYASPVQFRNAAEAKRAYSVSISRDPVLSQFPDDYDLVQIAMFDPESGAVVPCNEKICSIADLRVVEVKESGKVPGTFPVQASAPEVCEDASQEAPQEGQERHIQFGGYQK